MTGESGTGVGTPDPVRRAAEGSLLPGLEGRVFLVTGGSAGIGQRTVSRLATAGARVAFTWNRGEEGARETLDLLHLAGSPGLGLQADLTEEDRIPALFDQVETALGPVHGVVVNHGVWPPGDVPIQDLSTAQWRRTLAANLDSLFFVVREAARRLPDGGALVLLSSTAAQRGEAFHADYAAAKGAVLSLAKSVAVELGPRGIRVNAVAPGWVDTPMVASVLVNEIRAAALSGIPLGRIASADDVAGSILFLLSDLARHVTGEVLNVNGGAVRCG